ncbi:hypothetical protein FJ250_11090 [bacterium]|nr:hypothetical protein [bacterium]
MVGGGVDPRRGAVRDGRGALRRLHVRPDIGVSRCGVMTDRRGATLRLGPAPYLSDEQLTTASVRHDTASLSSSLAPRAPLLAPPGSARMSGSLPRREPADRRRGPRRKERQ